MCMEKNLYFVLNSIGTKKSITNSYLIQLSFEYHFYNYTISN